MDRFQRAQATIEQFLKEKDVEINEFRKRYLVFNKKIFAGHLIEMEGLYSMITSENYTKNKEL